MHARIVSRSKLFYDAGADPALDRPAHVRAASGVVSVVTPRGRRWLLVQDDASFLALVDPASKRVDGAVALPAVNGRRQFDEASGTKKDKLDLESVLVLDDLVVAFGSGSTDKREQIVVARVDRSPAVASVLHAPALYAAMRAQPLMRDAELNLEGVARVSPHRLRFFQRGNGAGSVDATFDVDVRAFLAYLDALSWGAKAEAPVILESARWSLGDVNHARLTFTDACAVDGTIYVVAAAEASPNAVDDGEIVGCAFGVLGTKLTAIRDENDAVYVGKPEGIAFDPSDPTRGVLVVDKDDPTAAAELLEIRIVTT